MKENFQFVLFLTIVSSIAMGVELEVNKGEKLTGNKVAVSELTPQTLSLMKVFERWSTGKLNRILVCPQYLKAEDTKLTKKNMISVGGFGVIEKDDAKKFVEFLKNGPYGFVQFGEGYHVELYFLFDDLPFTYRDRVILFVGKNSLSMCLEDVNKSADYVWVELPKECEAILKKYFTTHNQIVDSPD
jgi:hypothetical protein